MWVITRDAGGGPDHAGRGEQPGHHELSRQRYSHIVPARTGVDGRTHSRHVRHHAGLAESDLPPPRHCPTGPVPRFLLGRVVSRLPTNRRVVALTFDAGANGDGVPSILSTLAGQKVAACFFLTGRFVNTYPSLARRMAAAGRLGNHTTDHAQLPSMAVAEASKQVTNARDTILRVTGDDPRPLFRFPFGESGTGDLRQANALGYVAVGWTVDTLGWQGTSGG